MQNRSELYNKMMRGNLRGVTASSIYIGAINQEAQRSAIVQGSFWKYANLESPISNDEKVERPYFSWEGHYNKIDGTRYFPPELNDEAMFNNGIVTSGICTDVLKPEISFKFAYPSLSIKGLTVEFGEYFPKTFTIETNKGSFEYECDSGHFITEDVFEQIDYIKFIPQKMQYESNRFRIERIQFGIGVILAGNKILNLNIKEKTHPISLELPTIDLSFTVDNQDRYFNANEDSSVINFLERGQRVEAYFYQTLEDGSQEIIRAACVAMDSTWKDKGSTAEFSATDILYQLNGIYENGIYRSEGITAAALLKEVFEEAGLNSTMYSIDPYLSEIVLHNPLPKDTYANCILLIANACRCVLRQDRYSRLIVKSAFIPELSTSAFSNIRYSSADLLLKELQTVEYFEWQKGYNRLDGKRYWHPEKEDYLYAGYVSNAIADADGNFEIPPMVILESVAAFTFFQLTLEFGDINPKEVMLYCYNNGFEVEHFSAEIISGKQIINHSFIDVDKVEIVFTKTLPYTRIHLQRILIDESTDFIIQRDDMLQKPITERQSKIKEIDVVRTVYCRANSVIDIFSDTIIINAQNCDFKVEFNEASIPVSVITKISSDQAEIVTYSNWYCKIHFNSPPEADVTLNITIQGYAYLVSNPKYVLELNSTGITPAILQNPLIDSQEMAKKYAQWCAEYYRARAEYTMPQIMGNPILESNDLAMYEDENGEFRLLRIHTVNLKFDGTYNGSSYNGRSV